MEFEQVQIVFDGSIQTLPKKTLAVIASATKKFLSYLQLEDRFVNILFCHTERIRTLNNLYRSKNSSTDILSWGYGEEEGRERQILPWGELAICLEICAQQAEKAGWNLETELLRLIAHGIAHLKGFDHETVKGEEKMLQLELELLSLINLENLYTTKNTTL